MSCKQSRWVRIFSVNSMVLMLRKVYTNNSRINKINLCCWCVIDGDMKHNQRFCTVDYWVAIHFLSLKAKQFWIPGSPRSWWYTLNYIKPAAGELVTEPPSLCQLHLLSHDLFNNVILFLHIHQSLCLKKSWSWPRNDLCTHHSTMKCLTFFTNISSSSNFTIKMMAIIV